MNKFVLLLLVILFLPSVYGLSYSVSLSYDSDKFILKNVSLSGATGSVQTYQSGEYAVRIMSYQDKLLYESTFNVASEALFSIPLSKSTSSTALLIKKERVDLAFPYYSNAKTLKILKNKVLLLEVDLSTFSTCNENMICEGAESFRNCVTDCTCGNGFCEENYLSCSIDCSSGQQDGVCDKISDGICDSDCDKSNDIDCEEIPMVVSFNYIYLVAGILIIVVFGIILWMGFWKKQNGVVSRKKK